MSSITCKNCGLLLKGNDKIQGYCPACQPRLKEEFLILKEFLQNHPNASIMDVVNETSLSLRTVRRFVEEEKIGIKTNYQWVRYQN